MPNYHYKARDNFGKPLSGVMSADDESAVAVKLNQLGYTPIAITEAKQGSKVTKFLGSVVRKIHRFKYVYPPDGNFAKSRLADLACFRCTM